MKLVVHFGNPKLNVSFSPQSLGVATKTPIARDRVERDPYTGDYSITPSSSSQVLATNGLRMTDDITINPIPSNYGLITTNGSVITVS